MIVAPAGDLLPAAAIRDKRVGGPSRSSPLQVGKLYIAGRDLGRCSMKPVLAALAVALLLPAAPSAAQQNCEKRQLRDGGYVCRNNPLNQPQRSEQRRGDRDRNRDRDRDRNEQRARDEQRERQERRERREARQNEERRNEERRQEDRRRQEERDNRDREERRQERRYQRDYDDRNFDDGYSRDRDDDYGGYDGGYDDY